MEIGDFPLTCTMLNPDEWERNLFIFNGFKIIVRQFNCFHESNTLSVPLDTQVPHRLKYFANNRIQSSVDIIRLVSRAVN